MAKKPLKKQLDVIASQVLVVGFAVAILGVLTVKFAGFYVADKFDDVKRKFIK